MQYIAAAIEIAAVEQKHALAIVDARLRAGRQHEAAQQRRDALRVDREVEAGERFVRRPVAFAGLQFEQLVGVDGDRVSLDRRGCRNRARDDLALHQQALHARVDQAGAELREIENADQEREQADEVEDDDAPRQRRKAVLGEKAQHAAKAVKPPPLRSRRVG